MCLTVDEHSICEAWRTCPTFRSIDTPLCGRTHIHSSAQGRYIVHSSTRAPCTSLGTRSTESKEKILAQLKKMVQELRLLPPPSPHISNVDGGPVYDCRFPGTSSIVGPFDTIHDFHDFLCNGVQADPMNLPDVNRMVMLQDHPWPMPVFTHGDLSSFNILAHGDDIVGIIDWEMSGWYPSYWEYSMA